MPNSLEGSLTNMPGGFTDYLVMQQYLKNRDLQDQQRAQQQQFIQERQNLGPSATPQDLTNLGMRYADPNTLVHYGQAALDRKEALAERIQNHNQLIDVARERLVEQRDQNIRRLTDKSGQDAIMNDFRERDKKLAETQAANNEVLKRMGLAIQQQNADTNARRVDAQQGKQDEPLLNFIDKIDATKRMIEQNPEAVGGRGMLGRGAEFVGGMLNPGQETPASNLQTQILDLQTNYRGLPGHAQSRLKIDAANIDKLIKGAGLWTNASQATGSLDTLRESFVKALQRRGVEAPPSDPGTTRFPPAPRNPADRVDGVPYTTPKGVLRWNKKGGNWLVP